MKTLFSLVRMIAVLAVICMPLGSAQAASKTLQKAEPTGGIMQQLKAKGATIGPMTPAMRNFSAGANGGSKYTCDSTACWCSGGSDCLNLMDNQECKHWRCGNDAGQPVCWCDL